MQPELSLAPAPVLELTDGWRMALSRANEHAGPADAERMTDWIPARAPTTAAAALEAAQRWSAEAPTQLHERDIWWRTALPAHGPGLLTFEGLATIAEVWLDDTPILSSRSMFEAHEVAVDLSQPSTLWICCRALAPALGVRGPRPRWRPLMIEGQGLRLVRTTLLGHMPGWCPPIDIVGPWRPVRFTPQGAPRALEVRIRADWNGGAWLCVEAALQNAGEPRLSCAGQSLPMERQPDGRWRAELWPTDAQAWWPHTHGGQPLYRVEIETHEGAINLGLTGFRRIEADRGADGRGFGLRVNGEAVFCRGACWISPSLTEPGRADLRDETLWLAREAGFNMVRVAGIGVYEDRGFFDACAELGLLVWQDFMFANFDYPADDPQFLQAVEAEAATVLAQLQGAPALAVLCGGSEVAQQALMMGVAPPRLALFEEVLAQAARSHRPDAIYLPNTPWGGPSVLSTDEGVSHYYGVGAYERAPQDARRAEVKFAAECLGFANVPQPETLAGRLTAPAVHDPRWKRGTPRDRGASWDFEDVRDHYLAHVLGCDPARLRREDPALYLDLSRLVSGEVMAQVFTEWRRARSPCQGGLVWTLRDLEIGAGWGLIDAAGEPKACFYALKRLLQPVAVGLTDEGLNGVSAHLFNDLAAPVEAELRLSLFDTVPGPVLEARRAVTLPPRSATEIGSAELIGRFFDVTYAYRFGRRQHALVQAELIGEDGERLSQAALFVDPRAGLAPASIDARLESHGDGWSLVLSSARLLRYVHVSDPQFRLADDAFWLAPGESRRLGLIRRSGSSGPPCGEVFLAGGHLAGVYGEAP